jgi:hypothetical protein
MEQDSALPAGTVIDSSLQKVRDGAAYVGIIGARYGNIPDSAECNPEGLSLTELEFREARDLGRPILLFIMGPDHEVKQRDVEQDPEKRQKLEAFQEEAKKSSPDSSVHRVYKVFNSLGEFEVAATQSVAELRRFLDAQAIPANRPLTPAVPELADGDGIPAPPVLYAEPRYIGSHAFVGRTAQLATLSDWAAPAEAHPVMLFEAIGGTGKSMLTWEWTTRHATEARDDWAGLFWYSFYEKGAVMADFCRRALAYMTSEPLATFGEKKQPELSEQLVHHLQARSWLLILDGLERILVAYHRYDAPQLADEQAGRTDEIAHRRDPRSAILPLDDDLLSQLAAASPSKILVTSRLVPGALVNAANQPIPGVRHERLPGLRPADAEALLRTCGVHGDSQKMQEYLQRHCDCHPLVIGVVAGLINDYLPDRGHFDAWAADPGHGGRLNLAHLDLVQKRNHILTAALQALPNASRQLLSTLSLLPESFDYTIIAALNPNQPPEPQAVPEPERPENSRAWDRMSKMKKEHAQREYAAALERRREYEQVYAAWQAAPATLAASEALTTTIRDLEQRGLLQYERQTGRWDLHPVVRAVASSRLRSHDRDQFGQQIIDYYSQRPHNPYVQARTPGDLHDALTIVRTLFQMGRKRNAWDALKTDLVEALLFNMEAYPESLSLLRPFFPDDWPAPSEDLIYDLDYLASITSIAFAGLGEFEEAVEFAQIAASTDLATQHWRNLRTGLSNISGYLRSLNQLALSERYSILALRLAEALNDPAHVFSTRLNEFEVLALTGRWDEAEEVWNLLDPMGRDWPRTMYRQGGAESSRLQLLLFPLGRLTGRDLAAAERLVRVGQSRRMIRSLHRLRGRWRYSRGEYALAAESFQDAVRMAHEAGLLDPESQTFLALARFRIKQLPTAREEALRLSAGRNPAHLPLAELWHALADTKQAAIHAEAAYRHAWSDGEPYVRRYALDQAKALLQELGEDIPTLPAYDPAQHPISSLEEEITVAITRIRPW